MNPQRLSLLRPLLALQPIQSSVSKHSSSEAVVIADDGTIVCWHPEEQVPYKCTKLIPAQKAVNSSLLSSKAKEAMSIFRQQHPEAIREELAKITFTTKHRWYPRSRDKRAKKTAYDREYL